MDFFTWENEVYPKMHAEAYAVGSEARKQDLPRQCNLEDPKFLHKGKPLKPWLSAWNQGYDGWSIPPVFRQMEELLNEMPTRSLDVTDIPATWVVTECSHKVYSESGCTCCWHCPKCGKQGCDNLAGFKEGDTVKQEKCPNHASR